MSLLPDPLPQAKPELRVADADRDRVVEFLRFHCAEGRLTLDEFSDRVGDAYAAKTSDALALTIAELPVATDPIAPGPATASPAPTTLSRRRRAVRWTLSVMGGNQQKGRWRIDGETNVLSVMGRCQLDLRQAEVAGSEIVINAVSIMGGIDIVVPEGIEVVMQGISVMGGRNVRIADVPILPGSPIVRVRGLAVMGGISVRSKGPVPPPGAKGVGRRHTKDDARRDARQLARQARHDALDTAGRAVDDAMSRVDPSRRGRDRHDAPPARQARPGHSRQPPLPAGVDALMGTVAEQWRELRTRVAPEGTVTIMFSDIEGFTTIMERLGDHQASVLLKEHNDIIRGAVEKHRGFEVKNQGDGFMMAFDSASRALRCAIAIQQKLAEFNGDRSGEVIDVRIGMHTGEAIRDADDFFGNTVNVAARVAGEASGQEIVVSGLLKDLCAASGEFTFSGGDVVELRGLSQPQAIWSVRWE